MWLPSDVEIVAIVEYLQLTLATVLISSNFSFLSVFLPQTFLFTVGTKYFSDKLKPREK